MSGTIEVGHGQGSPDLLTAEEREVCGRIAAAHAPSSQRALALIALDQGVTQTEAAQLSGLTKGQVRYWRDRFREKRLGIFPEGADAEGRGSAQATSPPERARQLQAAEAADTGPSRGAGKTKGRGAAKSAQVAKERPKKKKQGKKAKKSKKAKGSKSKSPKGKKKRKAKKPEKRKNRQGKKIKDGKAKSDSKGGKKHKRNTKGKKRKAG